MKKKVWILAAGAAAVIIAGSAGIPAFGGAAKNPFASAEIRSLVHKRIPDPVQAAEAEEEEESENIIDASVTGSYVNETDGDGFTIEEDGSFAAYADFQEKKGKMIGRVLPQGEQWIFSSPVLDKGSLTGTFQDREWTVDGKKYTETYSGRPNIKIHFRGLYCNGENLLIWCRRMDNLEKNGLEVSADLDQVMEPQEISDDIAVRFNDAAAVVRAVNPYEKEAPLSDCLLCYFYTEDTTGTFTFDIDGFCCGEDCYDDLLEQNVSTYEKDRLVYKEHILVLSDFDYAADEGLQGEDFIDLSGDCDLTLNFEGTALKSFSYLSTELVNNDSAKETDGEEAEDVKEEDE